MDTVYSLVLSVWQPPENGTYLRPTMPNTETKKSGRELDSMRECRAVWGRRGGGGGGGTRDLLLT